ncbi:MAG: hypothetical protein LKE53_09245 [Oscillospiraceae bacterium]|jgi:phage gp46-like protein|nr:hypothetical protein [Oscillospiraceae bacterium]MDD3260435.1 hypothetical protein [Oscillospiraceae bacterium]
MEQKLENGDYLLAPNGLAQSVSGDAALLQHAQNRLLARRGQFVYNPQFGSRLHLVRQGSPAALQQAMRFAQEALAPLLPRAFAAAVRFGAAGVFVRVHAGNLEKEVLVTAEESGYEDDSV